MTNLSTTEKECLLKQYEQQWKEYHHLDWSYIQITVVYNTLLSVYIVKRADISIYPELLAIIISLLFLSVTGIFFRTRNLLNITLGRIEKIEENMNIINHSVESINRPSYWFFRFGENTLGKARTSTYLLLIVFLVTSLAIVVTFWN